MFSKKNRETEVIAATPNVGLGNPTVTDAIISYLEKAGFIVAGEFPQTALIRMANKLHIRMTNNTDKTIEYTQNSTSERNSIKALPLIWELENFVRKYLRTYPNARFLITPQNMLGEAATQTRLHVVMFLPDPMGKLEPEQEPTSAQKKINYLVWNRHAYEVMKTELGLKHVQLTQPIDPLEGYQKLEPVELKNLGYKEIFDYKNVCVIKLSGSGGDPNVINVAMASLWKNSRVRSIVFPGQKRTEKKLVRRPNGNGPKIKTSLNEGEFYNVARNMEPKTQMLLTYPSEQFMHIMVLSKLERKLNVVWLPPRGRHELRNLLKYILIATSQNEITTICIPKKHHDFLDKEIKNDKTLIKAGLKLINGTHYKLVDPSELRKEDFSTVPSWNKEERKHKNDVPRLEFVQAFRNVMAEYQ